jgi:hypothetical protein
MRELGKVLDETKPDVIAFLGSDHLDTFSMTCVPTFAIICGNRVIADHVGHHYDLPNHRDMAEDVLEKLIHSGFDMAYSEDAILGHTRSEQGRRTDGASSSRGAARQSNPTTHGLQPWPGLWTFYDSHFFRLPVVRVVSCTPHRNP